MYSVDIQGLSKPDVLRVLYNAAFAKVFAGVRMTDMSEKDAYHMVSVFGLRHGNLYGCPLHVDISGTWVDLTKYHTHNGDVVTQNAIKAIRQLAAN